MNERIDFVVEEPKCSARLAEVWELAQQYSDGGYALLDLRSFYRAAEEWGIDLGNASAALREFHRRGWVIVFSGEEGIRSVIVQPENYVCPDCRGWIHPWNNGEAHIGICVRRQQKLAARGIGRMSDAEWRQRSARPPQPPRQTKTREQVRELFSLLLSAAQGDESNPERT